MATVYEEELIAETGNVPRSQISWGAIFAGLTFVVASAWLLFLLGSAIGLGVADATDLEAIGEGLGIGAIVWLVVTSIVTFFLGSLLASRVAGNPDKTVGMMHGMTVWGAGTVLLILLGYAGVSGTMNTAQSLISGAGSAVASVGSAVASGASSAASGAASAAESVAGAVDSGLSSDVQARLKRQAAELFAQSKPAQEAGVSAGEAQQVVDQIDAQTLQTVATRLMSEDTEGAKKALADNTDLSEQQINELISAAEQQVRQAVPGDGNVLSNLQNDIKTRAADYLSEASAAGDGQSSIDRGEAEQVVSQLDAQTLQAVALPILRGNPDEAKNVLAVRTDLTEQQINDLVDGVSEAAQQRIDEFEAAAKERIETVSDYSQGVLWALFLSSAIGLAVCIAGGWLGADTVRRLVIERRVAVS